MNDLKVGDRVYVKKLGQLTKEYYGTVESAQSNIGIWITPDDQVAAKYEQYWWQGTGHQNTMYVYLSWCTKILVWGGKIEVVINDHISDNKPSPHIMGLSPESIDWDAYKAFMEGL